jgi:isoleucyl-tRNA synthetase
LKVRESGSESVHLEAWPVAGAVDTSVLEGMKIARDLASKGLEARMTAKINVRQPLATLRAKVSGQPTSPLVELIKDEVNVKEVVFGASIETDVELDTKLTPQLKEEGMIRELIRAIQDLRKAKGLSVSDKASLTIDTNGVGRKLIEENEKQLKGICTISDIRFGTVEGEALQIGDISFKLSL